MVRPHWEEWYEIVEDSSLRQGDIIPNLCAFAFPQSLPAFRQKPDVNEAIPVDHLLGDWIIMSASCDVAHTSKKYPYVLVGRVVEATSEKLGGAKGKRLQSVIEVIRSGRDPAKFMLAECPTLDPPFPRSFVQFRPHLTLPRDQLASACVGKRLRLRSPFREWFGNWVGSNFSRVGIDDDAQIPSEMAAATDDVLHLARIGDSETEVHRARGAPNKLRELIPEWIRTVLNTLGVRRGNS